MGIKKTNNKIWNLTRSKQVPKVLGTLHPAADIDGVMAAIAMVHMFAAPLNEWTAETIDAILIAASDSRYRSAFSDPKTLVRVADETYELNIAHDGQTECQINETVSVLQSYFVKHDMCFVSVATTILSVLKMLNTFYVFDPRPRIDNGKFRLKDGRASMYECESVEGVHAIIGQVHRQKAKYTKFSLITCSVWAAAIHSSEIDDECIVIESSSSANIKHKRFTPSPSAFLTPVRAASFPAYVYGTHCQADERYSALSRNNQCTAMAVFFVCYATHYPVELLRAQSIDELLQNGDRLYLEAYMESNEAQKRFRHLNYDQVPTMIKLFVRGERVGQFHIEYAFDKQVDGVFSQLLEKIDTFFDGSCKQAVLTTCGATFGIIQRDGLYHMFDSHSNRNPNNSKGPGVAVLVCCDATDQLAQHIIDRYGDGVGATTPVSIGAVIYDHFSLFAAPTVHPFFTGGKRTTAPKTGLTPMPLVKMCKSASPMTAAPQSLWESNVVEMTSDPVSLKESKHNATLSTTTATWSVRESNVDVKMKTAAPRSMWESDVEMKKSAPKSLKDSCSTLVTLSEPAVAEPRPLRRSTRIRSATDARVAQETRLVAPAAPLPDRRSIRTRSTTPTTTEVVKPVGSLYVGVVVPMTTPAAPRLVRRSARRGSTTPAEPSAPVKRKPKTYRKALEYGKHAVDTSTVGECTSMCASCTARHFPGEMPSDGVMTMCCNKSRTHFVYAVNYPDVLKHYMTRDTPTASLFREHSLRINNNLAFAAMETNFCAPKSAYAPNKHNMPEVTEVNGMITHHVAHLSERDAFVAGHTYMFETKTAVKRRVQHMPVKDSRKKQLLTQIFTKLENYLRQYNPFSNIYRMLKDVEAERKEMIARNEVADVSIHMEILNEHTAVALNQNTVAAPCLIGRYTKPTFNQVCIITSDLSVDPENRNIRVYPQVRGENYSKTLSSVNRNRDPLMYPLLFPRGEQSWYLTMRKRNTDRYPTNNINVSHREWAAYVLQMRDSDTFNPFVSGGKVANLWCIDTQMQIEKQFIQYIQLHQREMMVDEYSALADYVRHMKDDQGNVPGKVVVLPTSFTLGERHRKKNYHDCMSLATRYGKPSLFITFTMNPKWKEITSCLAPLEHYEYRPDLLCRVFKQKLNQLFDRITKGEYFGHCLGLAYTVEFQKRGWPHAHILVWIDECDLRLDDPCGIDSVVSARIPDEKTDPELYSLVKKLHIHGPCGSANPRSPCMRDGKCSKNFPRSFQELTVPNMNGSPLYRRPNDGAHIEHSTGRVSDNRYVVPYNPTLLREYGCHLNVEVVKSMTSVKYLFKYTNKGCDQAVCKQNFFVYDKDKTLVYDETIAYMHTRFMCSAEAVWHIYQMQISVMTHTVYQLVIHLPHAQNVMYDAANIEAALFTGAKTMLTEFFALNASDGDARQYLYQKLPMHYVFHREKADRRWTKRQKRADKTLARMYYVNPKNLELFSLKLLLLHVRGPESFQDLRTINGNVCDTFTEAARALGLLQSNQEWFDTMADAVNVQMPRQLRQLFVTICVFSCAPDPKEIFEKFKDSMCEDHTRRGIKTPDAIDLLLLDLQRRLQIQGKSLQDYMLPLPSIGARELIDNDDDLLVDTCDRAENLESMVATLNPGQKIAYDRIMNALQNDDDTHTDRLFFVDGFGGSGKTYLYDTLLRSCDRTGIAYVATAFTGIAASLLTRGRTVHSTFKFPIAIIEPHTKCGVKRQSPDAFHLRQCRLLVWDEVSQCPGRMLDAVNELLQELMDNQLPFGGKTVVVGGDFRQCLPIIPGATKTQVLHSIAKSSQVWPLFATLKLVVNMRLISTDTEFLSWQLAIGEGRQIDAIGNEYYPELVAIPDEMLVPANYDDDVCTLVDRTYGKRIMPANLDQCPDRMILTVLNEDVDRINALCHVRMVEKRTRVYYSVDDVKVNNMGGDFDVYPIELLNQEIPPGFPPHELQLKKFSPIMLLRNINPAEGFCNGTRLRVDDLLSHVIRATVTTGAHKGKQLLIPKVLMTDTQNPNFTLTRLQFPVKLNYAMTINKSQGQSFTHVSLFLRRNVFDHGQLYVAISRAREKSKCLVQICQTTSQGRIVAGSRRTFTPNVVFREVFG